MSWHRVKVSSVEHSTTVLCMESPYSSSAGGTCSRGSVLATGETGPDSELTDMGDMDDPALGNLLLLLRGIPREVPIPYVLSVTDAGFPANDPLGRFLGPENPPRLCPFPFPLPLDLADPGLRL